MPSLTIGTQPVYGLPRPVQSDPYGATIMSLPGLVARWRFTETAGNFVDMVSGLTLTATGTFRYGLSGPALGAVGFGSGAKAAAAAIGNIPTGSTARTVLAVWKSNTTNKECIASWGPTGGTRQWQGMFQEEYDTWADDFSFGAGSSGKWHLYAFMYDGATTTSVLVDNSTSASHGLGGTLNTGTTPFQTGLSTNNDGQATGTVDDLAVFNRKLTSTELTALYKALNSVTGFSR